VGVRWSGTVAAGDGAAWGRRLPITPRDLLCQERLRDAERLARAREGRCLVRDAHASAGAWGGDGVRHAFDDEAARCRLQRHGEVRGEVHDEREEHLASHDGAIRK